MLQRRTLLVGGGALALTALGWRAWDRGIGRAAEGPAYQPWRDWDGGPDDGLIRPLRAAILAANPHDTQPWIFVIAPGAIEVYANRARNLGSFDPFRREMHLGLGEAIENRRRRLRKRRSQSHNPGEILSILFAKHFVRRAKPRKRALFTRRNAQNNFCLHWLALQSPVQSRVNLFNGGRLFLTKLSQFPQFGFARVSARFELFNARAQRAFGRASEGKLAAERFRPLSLAFQRCERALQGGDILT